MSVTEKEIYSKAYEYIDVCTQRDGYIMIPTDIRQFLADIFVAGYMLKEKENG